MYMSFSFLASVLSKQFDHFRFLFPVTRFSFAALALSCEVLSP